MTDPKPDQKPASKTSQVEVVLSGKSRGFALGQKVKVDADRAAELVESGAARYVE